MNVTLQVGVKAFLKNKEGKYLIIKRSPIKYPNVTDCWDIVGGRIDPGTILVENLKREISEETQLSMATEPRLIFAQDIIPNPEKHIVRLTYIADVEGEPVLDTEENTEYRWLTVDEMKAEENLDKYVRGILDKNLLA